MGLALAGSEDGVMGGWVRLETAAAPVSVVLHVGDGGKFQIHRERGDDWVHEDSGDGVKIRFRSAVLGNLRDAKRLKRGADCEDRAVGRIDKGDGDRHRVDGLHAGQRSREKRGW
jgi:hypothetical protein